MKLINILLITLILSMSTGCMLFRNPTKSWDKAVEKQTVVENKVQKNEDAQLKEGRNYVYATKLTLAADPATNQFHAVETILTDKANVVLGNPTMEDENALRLMVSNLVSTNKALIAQGEKQLADRDAKVIYLQQENASLQGKLEKAEAKLVEVGTTNAGYASSWTTLMKFVWWAIYIVIGAFIIKILAVVLPPPYNSIVGIIALPIGMFTKLLHSFVPEAKAIAGVAAAEYKQGTQDLVATIQKLKEAHPELRKEIGDAVIANTDSNTSGIAINKAKSDLGIVS
jgi:hypothetical protein